MSGYPLHILGLIIVFLWWKARPELSRRQLLALWLIGLALVRLGPAAWDIPLIGGLLNPFGIWAGSLLLLRAFAGLLLWNRPFTRLRRILAVFLALYVILGPLNSALHVPLLIAGAGFVWSFRWRDGLGAGGLIAANLSAVVSLVLAILAFSSRHAAHLDAPGLLMLADVLQFPVVVYSLASIFATGRRIHLSIRSIKRRLLGSHILAGLVPASLAVLFVLITGALFISTYRGILGARILEEESAAAGRRLRMAVEKGQGRASVSSTGGAPLVSFGEDWPGQVLIRGVPGQGGAVVEYAADGQAGVGFPPDSLIARPEDPTEVPLVWDGRALYLRARYRAEAGHPGLEPGTTWEALAPVDSLRMTRITSILGVPIRINPGLTVVQHRGGVTINLSAEDEEQEEAEERERADSLQKEGVADTVGSDRAAGGSQRRGPTAIGPAESSGGLPGGATIAGLSWTGQRWSRNAIPIYSSASLAEQITSLIQNARRNPLGGAAVVALAVLLVLLLGAIWVALGMVVDMTRAITRAVRSLTEATAALREGRMSHRIQLEGEDELWSVASSFNEMAAGLEQMREVERQADRLEEELRLAREIQNRLLPAEPPAVDGAELAGISLPAREIGGDYFDYLVLDDGKVVLAIADVSGKGAPAALLMSTFRASLRSQDLTRIGPAEAIGRINRFIHSSVDPGRFITAFIAIFDPKTGTIRYANAGHDPPIVITPDGSSHELTGGGLILGLLPQIYYEEARAELAPGSLFLAFTDGVTEAQSPDGEFYGTERIAQLGAGLRTLPCSDVLSKVVDSVESFRGEGLQSDDITLIVLRYR